MIRLLSAPAYFPPENASCERSAKEALLTDICRQEAAAVADFSASFNPESIVAAAGKIKKSRRIFILPMISPKYSEIFWKQGSGCCISTRPSSIWPTWLRRRTACSSFARVTLSSSFPSPSIIIQWGALPGRRRTQASLS